MSYGGLPNNYNVWPDDPEKKEWTFERIHKLGRQSYYGFQADGDIRPNVLYAPHYTDWGPHINIGELTENADFVFKGQVTKIQYLNSDIVPLLDQAGGQIRDEEDNLVFESTSQASHRKLSLREFF